MKVSYVTDASRDKMLAKNMEKTGIKTKQALIDNAVVAFDWLVEKKEEGRLIIAIHNDGTERLLTMPVLTHVRVLAHAKRKVQDDKETILE